MPTANDIYDQYDGDVWVQPDGPNTEPLPLACAEVGDISTPVGDVSRRFCRQVDGTITTVNTTQGTPSSITFDVMLWKTKIRNSIQKAKDNRCPIPIYVRNGHCGRPAVFLSYDMYTVYMDSFVNSRTESSPARQRVEENDSPTDISLTYSLSADPNSPDIYRLISTLIEVPSTGTAEDEPFRDIASCSTPRCFSGACGAQVEACDHLEIVTDAAAAGSADGYRSADGGSTFAVWAAQPFAADEHISGVECFDISETVTRILVARGTTDGANPAEVAYSDDNGATWTTANVGATNGQYVSFGGALFALDYRHIWCGMDDGEIWFSGDGGVTWTQQSTPTPGASEEIRHIDFIDVNYGWAVGGFATTPTGLFWNTVDGGAHWNAAVTEPKVEVGNWVSVIDGQRVWVGLDDGTVYYSLNWGTTWAARTLPSAMSNQGDGQFLNAYIGALCGWKAGSGNGVAVVMRTFDGGYSWEEFNIATEFDSAPAYAGLNALWMCSANQILAVGEAIDSASVLWQLEPAGW